MNKQTCTVCPNGIHVCKPFNEKEFLKQAEAVRKTFEVEQDWEKEFDTLCEEWAMFINPREKEYQKMIKQFIHSRDKEVREQAYQKGFEDGSGFKVLEASQESKEESLSVEEVRERLLKQISDKNFDLMRTCDADCDEQQHAYHKGTWDHYKSLDDYIEELLQENKPEE